MTLRRAAQRIASTRSADWLVGVLERLDSGRSHLLPVLTYHRILDPEAHDGLHVGLCVSPAAFEHQLEGLVRRHEVIGLADLLEARHGRLRLPRRCLLLTFDDAYHDFETNAWPILRALGLPATLFVPTGYPDHPDRWFWWDRLSAVLEAAARAGDMLDTPAGRLPVATPRDRRHARAVLRDHCRHIGVDAAMSLLDALAVELGIGPGRNETLGWDALRRLAAEGVTMAPHSRLHSHLPAIGDTELGEELIGSRSDLEREIGAAPPAFAYPGGGYDDRVVAALDAAGYEVGFTTRRGVNDIRKAEWLRLHRINVGHRTPTSLLRAQLGSWMGVGSGR